MAVLTTILFFYFSSKITIDLFIQRLKSSLSQKYFLILVSRP
jgi:hypothetical protein